MNGAVGAAHHHQVRRFFQRKELLHFFIFGLSEMNDFIMRDMRVNITVLIVHQWLYLHS